MQLNLSYNQLCGIDQSGRGTFTTEGITAIADALRVSASVTSLSLAQNELGDDGVEALSIGLKENKSLKALDLSNHQRSTRRGIGLRGATALASAITVMPSMTSLDVSYNSMGKEGVKLLKDAVKGRRGFKLRHKE